MDTYTQSVSGAVVGPAKRPKRQLRTIAEKRQIVEETMVEGASVASIGFRSCCLGTLTPIGNPEPLCEIPAQRSKRFLAPVLSSHGPAAHP
jgi:hypothetical protein